jgi:hypothetical protein
MLAPSLGRGCLGPAPALFPHSWPRTLKEWPHNCGHQANDQYRQKEAVPCVCAGRPGEIDLRGSAAKHKANALGVIIKNQDVLHLPGLTRICRWQLYRLLNDENSFRPRAGLSTRRKKARRIGRTIFGPWLKERRVECSGPMRASSFHSSPYGKPSHHRYGASARFCRATYGIILTTSFEIGQSSPMNTD